MNLSMRWLDEFVHVDTPIHDFCEALTMSGSKVEGYETEGAEMNFNPALALADAAALAGCRRRHPLPHLPSDRRAGGG